MYQFKRYALFFGALMVAVMPYAIINAILISKDGVGLGSIGTLLIFGGSLFFASFLFHEIKLKYPKIQKTNKVDPKSEDLCNEPIQTEEMIPLEIEDANKEKAPVVSEIIEEKIETSTEINDKQHNEPNIISNPIETNNNMKNSEINKKNISNNIISVLVCVSLILNIILAIFLFNINNTISELKNTNDDLRHKLSKTEGDIASLLEEISKLEAKIAIIEL